MSPSEGPPGRLAGTNWAGNLHYLAPRFEHPASVEELKSLVVGSRRVRALGSRHSFTRLADSDDLLVDLSGLPPAIRIDEDAAAVSLGAGTRYGELAHELERAGWALANLASLPHISVAGAVATGTHGSGVRNRSLAAAVRALDVMGPDGEVRTLGRGDPGFDGSVVALGALGIVTRLELDIEPGYGVSQHVSTGLTWETLDDRFDEVLAAGYSVSLFTRFDDEVVDQVWVKARDGEDHTPVETFGASPARTTLHMLEGGDARAVTPQGGVPGPWLDRLPHFRMEFTPSNGRELQSEYYVARADGGEALRVLRGLAPRFAALLQVCEVRTIAADDLWLGGAYRRDSVAFHFTWVLDEPAVREAVRAIEAGLAPFEARPHWGKVFEMGPESLDRVFPRLRDFAALRAQVDPDRVFGNQFVDRLLG